MSLFVFFILAAVLLGAGAMLSPAWPTAQPRVALAATLCLGLVVGGAVFYAEAFGWESLAIDYLLFALLSGVVLGGTLSTAQARAEARGQRLDDRDQGWPGPGDLTFFAFAVLLLLIPLFHLAAPLGEAGQISGVHSLALRDGGSFNSLSPYHHEASVIVSPGFHALAAYLSGQLEQSIPLIQLSAAALVTLLIVWLAYDFGAELRDKRLGRAMASSSMLCLGFYRGYLGGYAAELLALLFMFAFLLYVLRLLRRFNLVDLAAAGLMMGAVAYTSLSISLLALLCWITLLILSWDARAPHNRSRLTAGAGHRHTSGCSSGHRPLAGQQPGADLALQFVALSRRPRQLCVNHPPSRHSDFVIGDLGHNCRAPRLRLSALPVPADADLAAAGH